MGNFIPKNYVAVHKRIEQFHAKYPNGGIETDFTVVEGVAMVKARVRTDADNSKRSFTGSAYGELKKEKALEKIETVAVGRALAFAGFEVQSGIASKEEMDRFEKKIPQPFDEEGFRKFKKALLEKKVVCESHQEAKEIVLKKYTDQGDGWKMLEEWYNEQTIDITSFPDEIGNSQQK